MFPFFLYFFHIFFIPNNFCVIINTKITTISDSQTLSNLNKGNINIIHKDQIITFPLCIGFPKQCIDVLFDTGSLFLWIRNTEYNHFNTFVPNKSSTFTNKAKPITLSFGSGNVEGEIVNDVINIDNTSCYNNKENFHWILGNNVSINSEVNGIAGFGKDYSSNIDNYGTDKVNFTHFSLINYLYEAKTIPYKIFAYKQLSSIKGELFIGEHGLNYYANNSQINGFDGYPKCFCDEFNDISTDKFYSMLWTCPILSIYVNILSNVVLNKTLSSQQRILFDSGTNIVQIPNAFFSLFMGLYEKYSNNNCYFKYSNTFVCKKIFNINALPLISLYMGNFTIEINPEDVLEIINYDGMDFITYSLRMSSWNEQLWIIGTNVLKKYHTIYDMEEGSIGVIYNVDFGSEKALTQIKIMDKHVLFIFVIFVIIICFLCVWNDKCNSKNFCIYKKKLNDNNFYDKGIILNDIKR
jgi:hypothetical protein